MFGVPALETKIQGFRFANRCGVCQMAFTSAFKGLDAIP